MAKNWWEQAPLAEDNAGNWWEKAPLAESAKPQDKSSKPVQIIAASGIGLGKGTASTLSGLGRFVQAPVATTGALVDGFEYQLNRGAAWLNEKLGGGQDPEIEAQGQRLLRQAQQSSLEAEKAREQNIAVGHDSYNPLTWIARAGKGVEEGFKERADTLGQMAQEYSPDVQADTKKISDAEGFWGTLKAINENPAGMVPTLFESLPAMAIGAIGAAKASQLILSRGTAQAEAAAARAAAAGLDAAAQRAAAEAVLDAAKSQAVRAASGIGVGSEAFTAALQTQGSLADQVNAIPFAQLQADSPRYRELLAELGDPYAARQRLATEIGDQAAGTVGLGTAIGSRLTSRIFGGDETAKILSGTQKTTFRAAAKNTLQEGVEEVLQGIPQDLAEHGAMLEADPFRNLDLGGSAAQNLVAGMAMGGPSSFAAAARDNYQGIKDGAQGVADRFRKPEQAPTGGTSEEGAGNTQPMPAQTAAPSAAKPSEAEKALFEPIGSTNLDRVQEIDAERARLRDRAAELSTPEYGQTFDTERAEIQARAQELQAERDQLTRTWPKMQAGAQASFTTEAGARVDAQYAIASADDLVTSHDTNLRQDPRYPQELQPRERERAASEMQISGIVQKLDPARLGMSADAANGAPIVGADGLVESGNARTIALKRTYEADGLKANEYRTWLRQNAASFGLDPATVDSVRNPVLVRVRQTPVNRAEFARQANASTVAQMSPSEQARADAKRIDTMEDLQPDESGDFSGPASRAFVRRFMSRLPSTEQGGMIDSDGNLSTAGYARIRNAVMAKAYGDSPVLQRMVESMDDNLRNVSKALIAAAPRVAAMREAVASGSRFAADFTPDLMESVEELSRLKESGTSLQDALAQTDLMGDKYSTETREILTFLADNMRRPKRMADFIVAYMEALDQAGDPNQAGLFGDTEAPTKSALMGAARRRIDASTAAPEDGQDPGRGQSGENAQADSEARGKPAPAQSSGRGDQGAGSAASGEEWVAFPPESGTLGIPRAEMPQFKGKDRGALLQFLNDRGIAYEAGEAPAASLKPTQLEFSRDKVERFKESGPIGERAVLVSSDGHVLDGHHQWKAMAEMGKRIPVIRIDAPIRELLSTVEEFPGVQRSEGAADLAALRREAVADFKAAAADLADILTPMARAALVPEKTPGLMPTLVRLFEAGARIIGTDAKRLTAWVQKELRKDPRFAKLWNRIGPATYQKAALQALENLQGTDQAQVGLFDTPEAASQAVQGDLFAQPEPEQKPEQKSVAPSVALIDGRPYDMARDNFKPPTPAEVFEPALLAEADGYVEQYFKGGEPYVISAEERAAGEALLAPRVKLAGEAKVEYDQKIIDIAKRTGALGQMIAPLKGMKRAVEKMHQDAAAEGREMRAEDIKDLLRSTIVVRSYEDADAVIDAIKADFNVMRIKDRRGADPRAKQGGYADVLINITMPNGTTAEIQVNVPSMLTAKENQGHKLYEAARVLPDANEKKAAIFAAMTGLYDAAYAFAAKARDLAAQSKNAASVMGAASRGPAAGMPGSGSNLAPSSDALNQPPSGNRTNSSPENDARNLQPAGNLSGNSITSPSGEIVGGQTASGYSSAKNRGQSDADTQLGQGSVEGQGAKAARQPAGDGQAQRVREGTGRSDRLGSGQPDAAGSADAGLGQAGSDGVRSADENRSEPQPGKRTRRAAGVPAGRELPAKSGLNYRFGPEDLTYEGSWAKKAEQNVEAVELLKRLQAEGRQATPEEQKTLAKFVGWGASELANNLFGKKLDKVRERARAYASVMAKMDAKGKDFLSKGGRWRGDYAEDGYYEAIGLLREIDSKVAPTGYYPERVTREDLAAAKPDAADLRYLALRDRLKAAMTPEEWAEAARSTQYAHYTSKAVVQAMWKATERMGFAGGAVLEPGAGIGVFAGLMPEGIASSSIYTGIEFDSITGGILQQLFPDEQIRVESFVDSKLPKNFYDVAIGNPPFSQTKILGDPEYAKAALSLHDYFFAKTIDRVKPGGLVMFVTSRYTMDKLNDRARTYLAERADLVGAIRLPQTAFKQNAGTEVVTDVIFLRKKVPGEKFEHAQPWLKTDQAKGADGKPILVKDKDGSERPALINEYFVANPDMVLGEHANTGSMYSDKEYTVTPLAGDIEQHFVKAIERLPAGIHQAGRGSMAEAAKVREIDFNPSAKKEGNYYLTDAGVLMQRESGVGQRVELKNPKQAEIIKSFIPLRDALKQAHYDQLNDGAWEQSLADLQKAYKTFTDKHGPVNQSIAKTVNVKVTDEETGKTYTDEQVRRTYPILDALKDDPDWTLVAALEKVNEETGATSPSDFLTTRVLGKPEAPQINGPADALLTVLNDTGKVDIDAIAARSGMEPAEVIEALGASIFEDPASGWVMADEYLSGNVKRKLEHARAAARTDRRFERNVSALEAVQPAPKPPSQINVAIGMNWIPGGVYSQFMREVMGLSMTVEWNARTKQWALEFDSPETHGVFNRYGQLIQKYKTKDGAQKAADKKNAGRDEPLYSVRKIENRENAKSTEEWGTDDVNAYTLMEHALTGRPIRVESTDPKTKSKTLNAAATEAANAKLQQIREAFTDWIWKDATRTDTLVRDFNDRFNTTIGRTYDGRHLTLPGASKTFKIFPHVKRGAWRIIQSGNTYLAHAVGSGKTFQMVISAMEQKRLGLIKKPMMVVPNHMLQQFASEWQQLYPAARLMVADENNFHTDNRRRFVSRVALSDLDGVVITHSAFKLLDLDPEFKRKMIEEQLRFLEAALEESGGKPGEQSRDPKVKQIQRQIENLEQKLEALMSSAGKDTNVRFDELGVDMVYVDEAHEFRKLDFGTSRQVKGISPQGSARAFDLFMKTRWLEEKYPGRSLVMASGTPITNTVAELYSVQRFMNPKALEERDIEDFDSWASMFGRESTQLEANAAGTYEPVTRFNKFVNVPELTQMFREYADVVTSDNLAELLGDKRPKVEGGARKVIVTPKQRAYPAYQRELQQRVATSRNWKPSKEEPNNPDPIIKIIGDGRLAAIDMRFADPTLESDPDSKLNRMIDDVIAKFKETADMEFRGKNKKDANGKEIEDSGDIEPNKGATMMVFSDLGFGEGVAASRGFNARAWFERRLRDAGVPMSQVAFMSDYKKSTDKLKLFRDVNAGRVRILVGSSKNMGTGVNAQQRLKALFHLDSPWYPSDLEQREGRIIRQGNKNKEVQIYAYAAKGTYDQVMWQMLASKQQFIDAALSGDPNVRELDDLSSQGEYELAAALTADDPRVLQLAGLRADIAKMQRLYQAHEESRVKARDRYNNAVATIDFLRARMADAEKAAGQVEDISGDKFKAKIGNKTVTERAAWASALDAIFRDYVERRVEGTKPVGSISGFDLVYTGKQVGPADLVGGGMDARIDLVTPTGPAPVVVQGGAVGGFAARAASALAEIANAPAKMRQRIADAASVRDGLQGKIEAPFPMAQMLADKIKEAADLEAAIAADSQPKPFWVENKATGKGFTIAAANAEQAIEKARETNGGNADEWTARPADENAPNAEQRLMDERAEQTGAITPPLSRATGIVAGVKASELDAMVAIVSKSLPGLPPVKVFESPSELPANDPLRRAIEARGAMGDVEGALHNGTIYLFARHLADMARAEHVLLEHEAAHAGLRVVLGDKLGTTMQAIYNQNAAVRRQAEALRKANSGMTVAEAVEEILVDIPSPQLAKLTGWRRLVERARDFLQARGYKRIAGMLTGWLDGSLTQQQRADLFVANLVREARAAMARPRQATQGTALSQNGKLSADLEAQEKWLQAEARARGFKDIEDLLAQDYPLFEKLAEKWREKNPVEALLSTSGAVDPYTRAVQAWQAAMARAPGANAPLAPAGTAISMPLPTVFMAMGVKARTLDLPVRYLQGILGKHADLPANVLTSLPQLLSEPLAVFPHKEGGFRVVLDAKTEKGEPIVAGIGADGRIQTVTPLHNEADQTGAERLAAMLNAELAREGAKVYARKKETLSELRVSRGSVDGNLAKPALDAPSARAVPAIHALHRSSRDKAIVMTRDKAVQMKGEFGPGIRLSRATPEAAQPSAQERADAIINDAVGRAAPLDRVARAVTKITRIEQATSAAYDWMGRVLMAKTPEKIKAGIISDYGVPEAVIDQRAMLQGRQRVQLRKAGALIDKLATLTRAESRVAYAWMNEADPQEAARLMDELPAESVKVLGEVSMLIDKLSKEAIAMGQLSPEAYERNKFAYLRRSYLKHVLPQDDKGMAKRSRTISILGEQYKGRGLTEGADMRQIQNSAPEWWRRKVVPGKADTSLKGQKFVRLERRGPVEGAGMAPLLPLEGPANPNATSPKLPGKLREVHYYPAGEPLPAKYADWEQAGTWEVRGIKGGEVVMWRDFTKAEREKMGEIDEARFAIAKTLHGMIHDVEVGRYLEWLAHRYALKPGQEVPGKVVDASERFRDTYAPGEWVKVPETKIPGTNVLKYGKLAGRYLPGPIWNDLRQTVSMETGPLGETYQKILTAWKTAKTALSPAVHTNNIMSNFVMADWHDVGARHIAKALRILLAAQKGDGKGLIGRTGNNLARVGIADREAAREIVNRYLDSGGDIGSWVTSEIANDQIEPLLQALQAEADQNNPSVAAQVGVFSALQHALNLRFPEAWEAFKAGKHSSKVVNEANNLIDLYQAEDDVFRLAAWLKAKEDGKSDLVAGKAARTSFLDYRVNAPWIQAMRQTAWPFISFSYRAIPMLIETAGKRPHKLLKLMAVLGALNALGTMLAGGGDDRERELLPEEKAGRIWWMVPKLIRMPWNDDHGSPVYLDIRRFIPVGDIFDVHQGNAATPMPPFLMPGGPLMIFAELWPFNKSNFTGKSISLETDTGAEVAGKVVEHLWKAFMPNLLGVPYTYATQGVWDATKGRTDAFGREMSVTQAVASSFGVKLGSYPADVLRRNLGAKAAAEMREIDLQVAQLRRQRQTNRITDEEFREEVQAQYAKKQKIALELQKKQIAYSAAE